jgi:flagellar basal body-associated protein FliL
MAENTGSTVSGPNIVIIVVVALLLVAGIAFWAMTRNQPAQKPTTSGSAPGDKDADVNLKVNLPDSVTIDAH